MSKILTCALAGAASGTPLLDEALTSTLGNLISTAPGENIVADDPFVQTFSGEYGSIAGPSVASGSSTHVQNLPGSTDAGAAGTVITEGSIAPIPITRTLVSGNASTFAVTPGTPTPSFPPVVHPATITLPKSPTVGCENTAKHGSVNLTNLSDTPTQD